MCNHRRFIGWNLCHNLSVTTTAGEFSSAETGNCTFPLVGSQAHIPLHIHLKNHHTNIHYPHTHPHKHIYLYTPSHTPTRTCAHTKILMTLNSGDGGLANDPFNQAQSLDRVLGKILRIDVDATPKNGMRTYGVWTCGVCDVVFVYVRFVRVLVLVCVRVYG